ncbi:hypothetical protein ACQ5SP_16440 [Rhodovulum sp. YNF3179]|uniref:hypothetical protein n=1 Tax=Rhodovulum sp. YNF3179 TaxID=3425127 RepID=UPI003D358A3C
MTDQEITKQEMTQNLDAPWAIGKENYSIFTMHLSNKVKNIFEAGSGYSTINLAADFPNCQITSLEESLEYTNKNRNLLTKSEVKNANIYYCPISVQLLNGVWARTYKVPDELKRTEIDALLIDGPTERRYPGAREAVLYFLFPQCKVGAIIALDDFHRQTAKLAVKRWQTRHKDELKQVFSSNTLVIFEKVASKGKSGIYPHLILVTLPKQLKNLLRKFLSLMK